MTERIIGKEFLREDQPSTPYPYFERGEDGYDKYGNMYFPGFDMSPYAVLRKMDERDTEYIHTGLLISPEGQELFRSEPGLLQAMNHALETIVQTGEDFVSDRLSITEVDEGGQSYVYKMELHESGKAFCIKMHNPNWHDDIIIPPQQLYTNEMLQLQAANRDPEIQRELVRTRSRFPNMLFASGSVLCREWVDGDYAEQDIPTRKKIEEAMKKFIFLQKNNGSNDLFSSVESDVQVGICPRMLDIIVEKDGTHVFLDPFAIDPKGSAKILIQKT